MRVKLLKDIYEGGRIKVTEPRPAVHATQLRPTGEVVELLERPRRGAIVWEKGAIISMSEASAAKYIERGDAEEDKA